MANIGAPISIVLIPILLDNIFPTVLPQGLVFGTTNSWKSILGSYSLANFLIITDPIESVAYAILWFVFITKPLLTTGL